MSFIFFFLFLIFLIFAIVLSVGVSFLKLLFGRRPKGSEQRRYSHSESDAGYNANHHKKVFRKDEGEYVDYEEIE